ncbi:MAG: hypothetical protein U0353_27775 [Sandaracinus sp.]|jgi:hypothetical protein
MSETSSDETSAVDPLAQLLVEIDPRFLEPIEDTLAMLHHDVGKYITRIARNVPAGAPVPTSLGAMLLKDLYETHRGKRASSRFSELVGVLPARLAQLAPMREAAAALARIDAAEPAVRALEARALAQVVADAREVELSLSLVLRAVRLARVRRDGDDA